MKIACPYCSKVIPDNYSTKVSTAIVNVEAYGSGTFTLRCPHCSKVYKISLTTSVILVSVDITDEKATSFG